MAVWRSPLWTTQSGWKLCAPTGGFPPERKRHFIYDYIADGNALSCMVLEVPLAEYRAWNQARLAARRNRRLEQTFGNLSLNGERAEWQIISHDALESSVETAVCDRVLMEELRKALSTWKSWANDMLDFYLAGEKRSCTAILAEKYGVSVQVIRKYKRQFEKFVKNFLEVFRSAPDFDQLE